MKTSLILLSSILLLAACKKEEQIVPKATTNQQVTTTTVATTPVVAAIPDTAMVRIRLANTADATQYDETLFIFNHASTLAYGSNDAAYFQGFGQVSLSGVTSDNRNVSIYGLPYTAGMSVPLNVNTKADGSYSLGISYESKIPSGTHVWVKDAYLKDSVDVCKGNYSFNVAKADTNSFGSKRFKLVFTVQAQVSAPH
jgi:hypothetical protein